MPPPHGPPLPSLHKSWPTAIAVPAPSGIFQSVFARVQKQRHTFYPRRPTRPTAQVEAGNRLRLRGTSQRICGHRPSCSAANRPCPSEKAPRDFLGPAPPLGDTQPMSHQSFQGFGAPPPATGGPESVVVVAWSIG